MAESREAAHEATLVALLNGVREHTEASTKSGSVAGASGHAAAAKDLAEPYAWLRNVSQCH